MVTAAAYQYPHLRRIEDELPDAIGDLIGYEGVAKLSRVE